MYLSRIKLNTSLTRTMQALAAPNLFHGAVEAAEGNERTRKLWRTDTLNNESYLLILSEKQIDFSSVAEQFGYNSTFESKCYDSLLERIKDGTRWQFRLKANPTVEKYDEAKSKGKIIAHITPFYQKEWLKKRTEKNGFSFDDDECLVTASKWYRFRKQKGSKNIVSLLSVTYEGILTVTDAELFRKALVNGIGREKAYGLGMMTVSGIKYE